METLQFKTNINCGGCVAKITPFLNQLENFVKDGYDPVKLIDLAIASGWTTVYARDEAKTKKSGKPEWMKGLTIARS